MKRKIYDQLVAWKQQQSRKPLVLDGARQVGKTWILKEFARLNFKQFAYLDFRDQNIRNIFEQYFEPNEILKQINLFTRVKIDNDTLLIFDEIQKSSAAISSLKTFCEKAPSIYIVCAGSLLGLSLQSDEAWSVGKTTRINMYPMDFEEFLLNVDETLFNEYKHINLAERLSVFNKQISELYKTYLIVGGMPEVVQHWIKTNDYAEVIRVQDQIIYDYEKDITAKRDNPEKELFNVLDRTKIIDVFKCITSQISKVNPKFIYSNIIKGARSDTYDRAVNWIIASGITIKVCNVKSVQVPLKPYIDYDYFKLYILDVGLLLRLSNTPIEYIFNEDQDFIFKGPLVENFVIQQLRPTILNEQLFYTELNRHYELDFIMQHRSLIIPIECKGGRHTTSRSLTQFMIKFKSKFGICYSLRNIGMSNNIINIPLYFIHKTTDVINYFLNK